MSHARMAMTAVAALVLMLALGFPAHAQETATAELAALNDSGASGTAELSLDGSTLTVSITSNGLLADVPHAQHIHVGGEHTCPTADVAGEDGIVSTPEGQPAYGEIMISLTTEGDFGTDAALALDRFPTADADGALTYERTFDLSEIGAELALDDVVIVQHGIDTITPDGAYGPAPPESPLDPSLPLEGTAPATCGAVTMAAAGGATPAATATPDAAATPDATATAAPAPPATDAPATDAPATDAPATEAPATQTSPMPTGAVQAGGGSTSGVEHVGLLVVGSLALAGAGVLALRRRDRTSA